MADPLFQPEGWADANGGSAAHLFDQQRTEAVDSREMAPPGLAMKSIAPSSMAARVASALTAEGADATLEAIELGAVDFIAKPSGTVSLEIDRLRPVLVEKVRGAVKAGIRTALRAEGARSGINFATLGFCREPRPVRPTPPADGAIRRRGWS